MEHDQHVDEHETVGRLDKGHKDISQESSRGIHKQVGAQRRFLDQQPNQVEVGKMKNLPIEKMPGRAKQGQIQKQGCQDEKGWNQKRR